MVVTIEPPDGMDAAVLGTVCNQLTHTPRSRSLLDARTPDDSAWVHYLGIDPANPASHGCCCRAALRTECVPRKRISRVKWDDGDEEGLYFTAMRAMTTVDTPCSVSAGVAKCCGSATSGLRPLLPQPPEAMFLDETPPATPVETPRHSSPRTVVGNKVALSHQCNGITSPTQQCLENIETKERLDPVKTEYGGEILQNAKDDLSVPSEASIRLESTMSFSRTGTGWSGHPQTNSIIGCPIFNQAQAGFGHLRRIRFSKVIVL